MASLDTLRVELEELLESYGYLNEVEHSYEDGFHRYQSAYEDTKELLLKVFEELERAREEKEEIAWENGMGEDLCRPKS